MTSPTPCYPADIFLHLIVTFLTPLFLAAAGGDITYARMAALETVNTYAARHPTDLLPIAQVIAFGLATLNSLNRSMADTLSTNLVLRLRANAASLNRASEQCRRILRAPAPADTAHGQATQEFDPETERLQEAALLAGLARTEQRLAEVKASVPAAETPPAHATQRITPDTAVPDATLLPTENPPAQLATRPATTMTDSPALTPEAHRTAWATAMADVAREFTAELAHLPPAERRSATMRATALSSVAQHLLSTGQIPPAPAEDRSHPKA